MSNYSKVQFISWEIYTGPAKARQADPAGRGYYKGLSTPGAADLRLDVAGQCKDIDARLAFTADALQHALAKADPSPDTLKVFMGPEFLYRGAGGAYLHDLINGWQSAPAEFQLAAPYNGKWGGLFGGLQALAAQKPFENWLFVFGTAVSASFPTVRDAHGKEVLDPTRGSEIYNTALIQRGGAHPNDNYASRKHYKSGIDFLNWSTTATLHLDGTVQPLDPAALVPADALGEPEGSAVFQIASICDAHGKPLTFGIEICLDHAYSGGNGANHYGRLRTANQNVNVQLVPSGGMRLKDASIRLLPAAGPTPHAYAFNCDGLGNLPPAGGNGSHTQIWNGLNGAVVPAANKLFEASQGAALANTTVAPVAAALPAPHGATNAADLWNDGAGVQGAGSVRIMPPLGL